MFKTPKGKLIFQLICSLFTVFIALMLIYSICQAYFGFEIGFVTKIFSGIDSMLLNSNLSSDTIEIGGLIWFIAALVLHVLGFILSGGAKYAFSLYGKALSFTLSIPIAILNLILVVIVAVLGIVFALALAPIFSFYSAIKNYKDSTNSY